MQQSGLFEVLQKQIPIFCTHTLRMELYTPMEKLLVSQSHHNSLSWKVMLISMHFSFQQSFFQILQGEGL